MSDIAETYYVAGRLKDIPKGVWLPPDAAFRSCLQCNDEVMIHPDYAATVDQTKGVICSPCVQEITNMSVDNLFNNNSVRMMKILVDTLNRVDH